MLRSTKNENVKNKVKSNKHKKMSPGYSQIINKRLLCHLFLALLLTLLSANAQPVSKQLDPIDFFIQKLAELPQKLIAPEAEEPPSKKVDIEQKVQQAKKISLETVNFAGSKEIKTGQKLKETQNAGHETVKFTAPVDKELPQDN